jgi:CYTH domain-containing protein
VIDRTAGQGRYAQLEREQRWILASRPGGLDRPVAIVDLYIAGTRLRVRRMTTETDVVYKLGQKVRPTPDDPARVKLTNMYLSEPEYSTLARLGGAEISKTRWRWIPRERPLVVDVFEGRLAGLVLAETELGPDEPRVDPPPLVMADVTNDDRFSGGTLAATTSAQLTALVTTLAAGRSAAPGV